MTGSLRTVRIVTAFSLVLGFAGFEFLHEAMGANLSILLYGAYASQLALIVVVMLALFGRRLSASAAFGSVVMGLAATLIYIIIAIGLKDPQAFVLPPFFAISGAVVGYALFYRERRA